MSLNQDLDGPYSIYDRGGSVALSIMLRKKNLANAVSCSGLQQQKEVAFEVLHAAKQLTTKQAAGGNLLSNTQKRQTAHSCLPHNIPFQTSVKLNSFANGPFFQGDRCSVCKFVSMFYLSIIASLYSATGSQFILTSYIFQCITRCNLILKAT